MPKKQQQTTDDLLTKMKKWVDDWSDATSDAREQSERDRDYYDGDQWTSEELAVLADRNQPAITINRIAPKVNAVLGHEVRTRVDPEALPRTPQHEDAAIAATDALRYVADREDFDGLRSDVTEELAIEGASGCLVTAEQDGDQIAIKLLHVPWDRLVFDPHSRKPDFSDALYTGLVTWMYRADALALYPEKQQEIDDALQASEHTDEGETLDDRPRFVWADRKRKRMRVVEMYYREGSEWHVAHYARSGFLVDPTPVQFKDEQGRTVNPMLLESAFVTRDNQRYGLVRNLISVQDEINKRRSKALHLLSVRQFGMEEGAVLEPDKAREELAKPDGIVEFTPGALRDGRFTQLETGDMAAQQFSLLQEAKGEIDAVGPNAGSAVDAGDNARAFQAQQRAATMELEPFFDHLRDWQMRVFQHIWYGIRQFWPEERWLRVRDDSEKKGYRFVALNRRMTKAERLGELVEKGMPIDKAIASMGSMQAAQGWAQLQQQAQAAQQQGQQIDPNQLQQLFLSQAQSLPELQEVFTSNDVAQLDVDIVLTTAPDTTVIEQEEFERLTALAQSGIQIPPDVLIEASQLRNKRRLLQMMEEAKEDPAQAQAAEQANELQMQLLQSQVMVLQAQAAETQSKIAERQAKAELGIPAEAEKDLAIARRHETEAVGELQSQRLKDKDSLGGASEFPLSSGGAQ